MKKGSLLLLLSISVLLLLPGCQPSENAEAVVLTVMTHDSFEISSEVVEKFEQEYGVQVRFFKAGDTGSALNKAILAGDNPLGDIFYGVDNTFLSRALQEQIFESYTSPALAEVDPAFILDPQHRAVPIDYADVCINYDRSYFETNNLAPPNTLEDLLDPAYAGLLVVENPALSSPGLAFLLTTIGHFGDPGYLDYWQGLVENGVLVVNDWETAYYSEFSLWDGQHPLVVSYSSSPPFEFIYAESPLEEPPSASVAGPETCFRQIEFAGILQGTSNRDLAEKWIDFMLSPDFQGDMPLNMAVFPVRSNVPLHEAFEQYMQTADPLAEVEIESIAANRENWIQQWAETVLR
ncbi:MAG: thiamine ABC transporter substrate-binding protein [Anaerolineales bacterium]|nr:thiamine ABC transporter substrate-binding protein [Anaerolineales bacterium]